VSEPLADSGTAPGMPPAIEQPHIESTPKPSFESFLNRPAPAVSAETEAPLQMPPPPPMKTSSVRVALLLPLTGPNEKIGKAMLNAAQLALFSFSEKTFELLVHDTKGTPSGAIDAAQLAIADGARLILGPLLSASVKAIASSARAANVPVISFSSDRSAVGDGVFTLGFIPSAEVWRVVRYARKRGVLRFAALAPSTLYGETVLETFRVAVEQSGGQVIRVEQYDPNVRDFGPLIRDVADYETRRGALLAQRNRLKERDGELSKRALKRLEKLQTIGPVSFEALFLADGGKRLQAVAALLPFYDIDPANVRMLGTGQWDEPGIGREPALINGWYAAPPPNARANFATQYRQVYNHIPPRLATLAYDATALATVLSRNAEGPKFSVKTLTTPSGFIGRDGIFRLLPNGLPERGLAVLQVGPRSNKVISPAPESFNDSALN
jgi:branched-chain amino acid transport system substrate-binding protein